MRDERARLSYSARLVRRLLASSPLFALTVLALHCQRRPSAEPIFWASCTCEYLTDTDTPGKVDVRVCTRADDLEDTLDRARECAVDRGVGSVSSCKCDEDRKATCSPIGACDGPEATPR